MSTIAVFSAPSANTPAAHEWLRVVAALVATGGAPRLFGVGQGAGQLVAHAVDGEAGRVLETLASFDIRPESPAPAELVEAIAACDRIVRIGAPDRGGQPALWVLDDAAVARGRAFPQAFIRDLLAAGQVVRAKDPN